ncbi:GNAT family N-acetyltransferase [Microbacterium sp. p3-SID336]|uniref:GNAT family N-acetyltransferase n=1 Tax=Microbacterium sp. p3-SID336 TaxID=2916212 RepID=UPI0021A82E47|nr:GNAT family N-acetyltransferase [Microbacterium sp. p3-SID336]MCT1479970.1 GNAT family N-acetyltransferase [Microbacterium sp. p3-SID336]
MAGVTVRPMTADEFDEWMDAVARAYAQEQVAAGRWEADGAVRRARTENARMLPQGPDTPRMLVLRGLDDHGRAIGRAWAGLDHPRGAPGVAFLYDIEVEASRRGEGLGRGLLAAVEKAAKDAGAAALELNVFGSNRPAIAMYETAGYEVVTQQMRKQL